MVNKDVYLRLLVNFAKEKLGLYYT